MRGVYRWLTLSITVILIVAFALTLSSANAQPRRTPAGTVQTPDVQVTPPARPSFTPPFTGEQAVATATAFAGQVSDDADVLEATALALATQILSGASVEASVDTLQAYLEDLLGESAVVYDSATGEIEATVGITEAQWTETLSVVVIESGVASAAYVDLLADYGARVTVDGIEFEGVTGMMQVLIAVGLADGQPVISLDAASFNGRELPAVVVAELNAQLAALNLYDAVVTQLLGVSPGGTLPYAYEISALLITDDTSYVTAVIDTGTALPTPAATPALPRRRP